MEKGTRARVGGAEREVQNSPGAFALGRGYEWGAPEPGKLRLKSLQGCVYE